MLRVHSDRVSYRDGEILTKYSYETNTVSRNPDGSVEVTPKTTPYIFRTNTTLPKLGLMLVGWGGNNGSTVTAATIANREGITWRTKRGVEHPNYFGSITQCSTVRMGYTAEGVEVNVPLSSLVPMVHPNDIAIGGWDISKVNLAKSMERAQVLDFDLQRQLVPYMQSLTPLPSVYYPDFIAANQGERADNVLPGENKNEHLEKLRHDIRDFKAEHGLEKVIVLWTATTERFAEVQPGVNDTAESLLVAVQRSEKEISPSTIFAMAAILEGCAYINGSPQNTFVPGVIDLAKQHKVFIAGDDFKSGQTKLKSVLVEFLVGAGIKPVSIVSYNHLGNNDGRNLSSPAQFRSKEITKTNVVDDMVASNELLYQKGEHPDHCIVIKYVPRVGDSKRAMDEYISQIFMGGTQQFAIHNTCEDSLLASPLILDLAILTELMQRVQFKNTESEEWHGFGSILTVLSYLCKAPLVPEGTPLVNALFRQKQCIENVLRALVGLAPENNMLLEYKL
eukprot:TRINITY_DN599_c0_g1_i1.p1 TRINITY_DN599_c0_g1~~TRINITY_DN599_c0_g1_i1.p1  ORF type:complete len:507 (+),score=78.85 TRINITY_DN599_c0_g1_i1:34-1554(+)